jgi:RNA polymerase sigma-B factor
MRGTHELFVDFKRTGDLAARDELTIRFLPLAHAVARRYRGKRITHEPLDDVVQVANIGLLVAITRFDPGRGHAFSSFAVPTILGELKRYFRDFGWAVHVSRRAQELALRVELGQRALERQGGAPPTVNVLAEYLELDSEDIVEALETSMAHHAASLDAPCDCDEHRPIPPADALAAEDHRLAHIEERLTIASAAKRLSARERQIVGLRFGGDLTQTQIGEKVGISQMQVSRSIRRALERLRELIDLGA